MPPSNLTSTTAHASNLHQEIADKENIPAVPSAQAELGGRPVPTASAQVLGLRRRDSSEESDAFELGPRKRPTRTDPLVHHGRHFGRTVHTFCKVQALIKQGLIRMVQLQLGQATEEQFSARERREHHIFCELLGLSPGLEERLCTGSEQDVFHIAAMIMKGSSGARSDDTKSLKAAIIDWITPIGGTLQPPLTRNVKTDRGFHHNRTGELLCPVNLDWSNMRIRDQLRSGELTVSGDQWPLFLYQNYEYNSDDPWEGLFRSGLLICAFKHIFTSPSSVDKEPRATRSGNARIHGMTKVTVASLAYIATQVRFALSSSPVFSRSDLITDSERFYGTVVDILEDPEEYSEAGSLLEWWNRQIFPVYTATNTAAHKDSVIAKIKERRRALQLQSRNCGSEGTGNHDAQ